LRQRLKQADGRHLPGGVHLIMYPQTRICLRNVMGLLWWLGRDLEHEWILTLIGYQQNYGYWLAQHESQFLDVIHILRGDYEI